MTRLIILLSMLVLAGPARADISDSGNLTIGGNGVIQGTMTVQGGAFSVAGATFTVAAGSITLGGTLNAAASGIKWADGTTSTTAGGPGGAGTTFVSTYVYIASNFSVSSTDLGVCVGTAAWTSIGGRAIVSFTGAANGSISADRPRASFLIDGAFQAPYTSVKGVSMTESTVQTNMAFSVPLHSALAAGPRSICLTAWRGSGSNATFQCGGETACILHILEWK